MLKDEIDSKVIAAVQDGQFLEYLYKNNLIPEDRGYHHDIKILHPESLGGWESFLNIKVYKGPMCRLGFHVKVDEKFDVYININYLDLDYDNSYRDRLICLTGDEFEILKTGLFQLKDRIDLSLKPRVKYPLRTKN